MARTIAEIKKEIADCFITDDVVREKYGFPAGASFDSTFSKVSLESLLFYCVAACFWTVEKLFDLHKMEVTSIIDELKPHSLRWYVSKAKSFMLGKPLVPDTDYYDTSGMTDEQIEAARVVKYAAAVERSAVVYLKIAGDTGGVPNPIGTDARNAFDEYIREIKDAGVVIEVINAQAEYFRPTMKIYYNPMVLNGNGQSFDGTFPVSNAVKNYIKSLPFNGEYRNAALVDVLQQIDGVVIPELLQAESSSDGINWHIIDVKETPGSGYYRIYNEDTDLILTFIPYETV